MSIAQPSPASVTDAVSYEDLYARWERGNWQATAIDFTQDRIDWREKLSDEQRRGALWLYSLFFHGEDTVADDLSPYIDAAPREEQKYFLTTQQVDEARHAVFFKRFMHEVLDLGDGTAAGGLAATADQLSWGHRKVFTRLDGMASELRKDHSPVKLASAVTLYHLIVEALLAQPGQHMIEDSLERMDVLPGFREGMRNVALDEQRHIGFGVKLLADLYAEHGQPIEDAIVGTLREVLPWTTAVGMPPGDDRRYTECFGFSLEDIFEEGARSIEQKLKAIGLQPETIPGFPFPMDIPPRARGERGIRFWNAGYIGPPGRPVSKDPDDVALLFDQIRRNADTRHAAPGTVVQWCFDDGTAPWHVRLDNGSTAAFQGLAPHADVRLRVRRFEDFADIAAGREDAAKQMLKRRIRPRGDLRVLLRMPKIFG